MNMRTAHSIAAEIAEIIKTAPPFLAAQAARAYELVNSEGQEQAVLDALPDFGVTATEAVSIYAAMHGALVVIGAAGGLSAPDLTRFVPQEDGTVLYVAPVAPEPEPSE